MGGSGRVSGSGVGRRSGPQSCATPAIGHGDKRLERQLNLVEREIDKRDSSKRDLLRHGLGEVVGHAARETLFAVARHRIRGEGDDGDGHEAELGLGLAYELAKREPT